MLKNVKFPNLGILQDDSCGSLEESYNIIKRKKGEHNKTTEDRRSQRKASTFFEEKKKTVMNEDKAIKTMENPQIPHYLT